MEVSSRATCRILLVEDNEGDAELFSRILEDYGEETELKILENQIELNELISNLEDGDRSFIPDMIFLDLKLPNADGLEIPANTLSGSPLSQVPIVALTGYDTRRNVLKAHSEDFNAFLSKKDDPDKYRHQLESILDKLINQRLNELPFLL